jgi:hypothetical protein
METLEIIKLSFFAFFAIGVFYLSTKVEYKNDTHKNNLNKC